MLGESLVHKEGKVGELAAHVNITDGVRTGRLIESGNDANGSNCRAYEEGLVDEHRDRNFMPRGEVRETKACFQPVAAFVDGSQENELRRMDFRTIFRGVLYS